MFGRGRKDLINQSARVVGLVLFAGLTACTTMPQLGAAPSARAGGTMAPYQANGTLYRPREQPRYDEVGIATWYGARYHHHRTADGEIFDMNRVSGAHRTLPLPCVVEVTNLDNGRRIQVRVNDRGPFIHGRILDLSRQAARDLGFYEKGSTRVRVRYVGPAPRLTNDRVELADAP